MGVFVCLCVGLSLWVCCSVTEKKEDEREEKKPEFILEGEKREREKEKKKQCVKFYTFFILQ